MPKFPKNRQKIVENFVKNDFSTFSTAPITTTKYNILFDFCKKVFIMRWQKGLDMKFLSSLKAWKKRGNIKQVRRGKQVILMDPDNPKFKAKQGFKRK